MNVRFVQDVDRDLDALVEAEEPLAFARFHDGEHAVLECMHYRAASGWSTFGEVLWCRDALSEALRGKLGGYFIGISPPCCAPAAAQYYRKKVTLPKERLTFATLFAHANYRRLGALRKKFENAVLVSNQNGDFSVPKTATTKKWDLDGLVEDLLGVDRPILVAAGPCASIIAYRYWLRQEPAKRQTILDVGSAMDVKIYGKTTRTYHDLQSRSAAHVCEWENWEPFTPVTRKQRRSAGRRAVMQRHFAEEQERSGGALAYGQPPKQAGSGATVGKISNIRVVGERRTSVKVVRRVQPMVGTNISGAQKGVKRAEPTAKVVQRGVAPAARKSRTGYRKK